MKSRSDQGGSCRHHTGRGLRVRAEIVVVYAAKADVQPGIHWPAAHTEAVAEFKVKRL